MLFMEIKDKKKDELVRSRQVKNGVQGAGAYFVEPRGKEKKRSMIEDAEQNLMHPSTNSTNPQTFL